MGYQNSTYPIAIYGCIDTASRKILWLKVWDSNCKPENVGKWYLEYLYESRVMPNFLRVDKGTETGTMGTMHAFLRSKHGDLEDPTDSVRYGPSTSNQVKPPIITTATCWYLIRTNFHKQLFLCFAFLYFIVTNFRGSKKPRNFCILWEFIFAVEPKNNNSREFIFAVGQKKEEN